MRHNLELKAQYADLDFARGVVGRLSSAGEVEMQTDTYFRVPTGRLKLREIEGPPPQSKRLAVLIWYQRPDRVAVRSSAYTLVPVSEPELLEAALSGALGVRGVVRKRREIYLWHNVRIHLDEVDGLGSFVEFEAVLSAGQDEATSQERLAHLSEQLAIQIADLRAPSYADLLGL